MPCFSKQDILHPSAQLYGSAPLCWRNHRWLTSTINNTPEYGGASVFSLNSKYQKSPVCHFELWILPRGHHMQQRN